MAQHRFVAYALAVFWIGYAYLWGVLGWNWNGETFFGWGWWFDIAGHAVFGIAGVLTLLFIYRRVLHGLFRLTGRGILAQLIIAGVVIASAVWEGLELLYDFFIQRQYAEFLTRAQLNSADTTLDILVAATAAGFALVVIEFYRRWATRKHPRVELKEQIRHINDLIDELSNIVAEQESEWWSQRRRAALSGIERLLRETNTSRPPKPPKQKDTE